MEKSAKRKARSTFLRVDRTEKKGRVVPRPGPLLNGIPRREITPRELLRISVRRRIRRCRARHRLLPMSTGAQAQSSGRDGHDQDCFQEFHYLFRLLPLLVAAVLLGAETPPRNAFLRVRGMDGPVRAESRPRCPLWRDRTTPANRSRAFECIRGSRVGRSCPREWSRGCK